MEYCRTLQATAYITRSQCDEGIEHATLMYMHLLYLYAMNLSHSTTIRYLFGLRAITCMYEKHFVRRCYAGLGILKFEISVVAVFSLTRKRATPRSEPHTGDI